MSFDDRTRSRQSRTVAFREVTFTVRVLSLLDANTEGKRAHPRTGEGRKRYPP